MEYESVSGRGIYPHKVDIKSLLTYNLQPPGESRKAGRETEQSPHWSRQPALSLSEGSHAGLASDRDGDMISDRKL